MVEGLCGTQGFIPSAHPSDEEKWLSDALVEPPLLSETPKIQAAGAEFLAKSNLCSSEAELVGGIDRRTLTKK